VVVSSKVSDTVTYHKNNVLGKNKKRQDNVPRTRVRDIYIYMFTKSKEQTFYLFKNRKSLFVFDSWISRQVVFPSGSLSPFTRHKRPYLISAKNIGRKASVSKQWNNETTAARCNGEFRKMFSYSPVPADEINLR